jgi:spermidine synthase
MNPVHSQNSHFGFLKILERKEDGCRFLLDDNLFQNTYEPSSGQSVSHFTYMLSGLARVYRTNIHDVLCIGLGAGIVPMDFAQQGAQVDVVEINPAMVPIATRFFAARLDRLNITIDDGRHYLNRCSKTYDVIVLDVFLGDSSPSHLLTKEAFASMRHVLRPGGVLVINAFAQLGEDKDFFATSLNKTLRTVFSGVRMHSSGRNEMFFAASDHQPLVFLRQPDTSHIHALARQYAEAAYYSVIDPPSDRGRVLTDDYNPCEFFDAANREDYRRSMAMMVKGM